MNKASKTLDDFCTEYKQRLSMIVASKKLLCCPFCGNNNKVELRMHINEINWSYIGCGICLSKGPHCKTRSEAIKEWNDRIKPVKVTLLR